MPLDWPLSSNLEAIISIEASDARGEVTSPYHCESYVRKCRIARRWCGYYSVPADVHGVVAPYTARWVDYAGGIVQAQPCCSLVMQRGSVG